MNHLVRGCIAEFIGTFALVFFGAASIVMTHELAGSAGSLATIALTHGLVLAVFVTGSLYVSGGQFNPAVSIGLMAIGIQPPGRTLAFVAAQLVGAASGAGMLVFLLTPEVANSSVVAADPLGTTVGATIGRFTAAENVPGVVGLELLQTFALMLAVLTTAVDGRAHRVGGFGIGLTVAVCIMAFGPLTGSSMNPARTFGPALYGHWDMHWAYWAGPVAGSLLAALTYKLVWTEPPAARPAS
ncbi:MAG TPA: aquaporin [Phycisphaerales bacterium]|nr:aquaporin [Phycisphaerales bacterium]